ncbi:hypothetical protein PENSUB_13916 [Penicillium subrubescens]|uniref:Uncharacterized protein n=1 Tax=Penicillium subrubescens TaxID=1316194 RepID=A0A1Q5UQ29_9EURO|nr:hypothetical protein PENSUB_13916 [Penicillium subrubescens]
MHILPKYLEYYTSAQISNELGLTASLQSAQQPDDPFSTFSTLLDDLRGLKALDKNERYPHM